MTFTFDHPYEHARDDFFLAEPDGETIRSNRFGHFRVVSTRGNTPQQEIVKRIRALVLATYWGKADLLDLQATTSEK